MIVKKKEIHERETESAKFEKSNAVKYWIITLLFLPIFAFSQSETPAPYTKVKGLPPIVLTQLDNKELTSEDIRGKSTILMFFSPDCGHCKDQIAEMLKNSRELAKYQWVLATFQPEAEIRSFYDHYKLKNYSNIKIGRDAKFLLPPFFRIRNLPYLALYDAKGNLITTFEGNVKSHVLLSAFQQGKAK